MYDFSLLEQYTGLEYHVELINLSDHADRSKLETILTEKASNKNMGISQRKDYFNEKTGEILVHIEWFKYTTQTVSPFAIESNAQGLVEKGS